MKNFDAAEILLTFKHEKPSWSEMKSRFWNVKSEKFTDERINPYPLSVQIKVTDLKIKSGTERKPNPFVSTDLWRKKI